MLQLADQISRIRQISPIGILYVSGEESPQQIKIRAERLGINKDNIWFLAETDVEGIIEIIKRWEMGSGKLDSEMRSGNLRLKKSKHQKISLLNPASHISLHTSNLLVIVDSIQSLTAQEMTGTAGSIGQVRECAAKLLKIAKLNGLPVFLIGHITKAGEIAGPKVLEHMVDTVLYLEGERFGTARLLRVTKNRFGATDEVGVFEMTDKGMTPVDNPSRLFISGRQKGVAGSVVVATMEGTRPVLVEIQALVVPTQLAVPRRIGRGVDYHRLQLICAVLTKRLGLPLGGFDVFVNVAGGLRVEEPGADLGVALAIISSFKNISLDPKIVVFGELGLLGETRGVHLAGQRIKEAKRLGFTKIISPQNYSSINQVIKVISK
jgi:DNA repair protein RadA/Sms